MSTARKIRKLVRDPVRFFVDSKRPELQFVGRAIAPPVVVSTGAVSASTTNTASRSKKSAAPMLAPELRALDKLIGSREAHLWWRGYEEFVAKKGDVVVVPSGQSLWDHLVLESLKNGNGAGFAPMWEILGREDPDTQWFLLKKSPDRWPSVLRQFATALIELSASRIVFTVWNEQFSPPLAAVARRLNLQITVAARPDDFAEDESEGESVVRWSSLIDDVLFLDTGTGDSQYPTTAPHAVQMRDALGCQRNDPLLLFLTPAVQFDRSDEQMRRKVTDSWQEVRENLTEQTHLVVVLKRTKGGYLEAQIREELKAIYRKSVVTYDEGIDIRKLVAAADRIVSLEDSDEIAVRKLLGVPLAVSVSSLDRPKGMNATPGYMNLRDRITETSLLPAVRLIDAIHSGGAFNVVAVPDPLTSVEITNGRQAHLPALLAFNKRVYGAGPMADLLGAEAFVQWGAEPNESKSRPEIARCALGRCKLYVEDGFVRSLGLWTDPNEPSFSLTIDTDGAYYDATVPTLLERLLNSDLRFTDDELSRARMQIDRIARQKVSKYNYAPFLEIPRTGKRRILLVDQKAGDMSIKYGSASSETYFEMVRDALACGDDVEFLIKQHPCAVTGGQDQAHFTAKKLGDFAKQDNVELIAFDVNPYSLFDAVDEVWVVTSGMGFEALIAGKPVRTYGAPFYAGWGITQDRAKHPRRVTKRALEEIFHLFYNCLTRYVNPETGSACDLETLLDFIVEHRPVKDFANEAPNSSLVSR